MVAEETYSKCSPAINLAVIGQSKTGTVTGSYLNEDRTLSKRSRGDRSGNRFVGVQPRFVVRVITRVTLGIINVLVAAFPCSIPSKRALVIDAPSQDCVVMGEGNTMHAANRDLHDTHLV